MATHTSKEKMRALILYVCSKIPASQSGVIKMNKIIWFSETETMYRTWEPLTGHTFIRQKLGPVPLNMHIMREELAQEGMLRKIDAGTMPDGTRLFQFETVKPIDIAEYFTEEQRKIIDTQIEKYGSMSAHEISDMSHDSIWASLEDADEMPIELYRIKPLYNDNQKKKLKDVVAKVSREQYGNVCA